MRPAAAPIPFGPAQASGWEPLAGAGVLAMNVVVDGAGAVYRRPGITTYSGAPSSVVDATGIAGLFVTGEGTLFAVGSGPVAGQRSIYQVGAGGAAKLGGGLSGLRGTGRPVFAESEMLVLIAGGDLVEKIVKSTNMPDRLGGTPPLATHVILQSNRVLANDDTVDRTKVRYSDVALGSVDYSGHELWTTGIGGAGYFTAESRPDAVQALAENTNEAFVFGTGTTQCFQPDPDLVFAPTSTIEVGMSAPYSAVKIDQKFLWLDQFRRFVVSDGRTFTVISGPIQAILDSMATTSDCYGYRIVTGFIDAVAWVFPTDGRTFVFSKGNWSQWGGFAANNWAPFPVTAATSTPDRPVTVVGLSSGKIGAMSQDVSADLGAPIVASVTTGYINRDTDMRKLCKAVKLSLRRGETASSSAPLGYLSWRDAPGPWQQRVAVDLGASGDTEPVVTLRSLGVYRRRQWRFEFGGAEKLVLASVSEEYEVLDT